MQTAFFLRLFPPPPAGARIFSRLNGACTGCAANADEAFIVQLIVGHVMLIQVGQYFVVTPVDQRIKFIEVAMFIPFEDFHALPVFRLFCPEAGDPYLYAFQGPVERYNFADAAAFFAVFHRFVKAVGSFCRNQFFYRGGVGIVNSPKVVYNGPRVRSITSYVSWKEAARVQGKNSNRQLVTPDNI